MSASQIPELSSLLDPFPPKAAQLMVTIYGDIVEPRGGILWMGDLITLCADFGVNESLARTAVSRLVARKQLVGTRDGRRSFYGLTSEARADFHQAAELFFGPPDGECDLLIVHQRDTSGQEDLRAMGFAQMTENQFIGADRPGRRPTGAVFRVQLDQPVDGEVAQLLDQVFGLPDLAQAYHGFVDRFKALASEAAVALPGDVALTRRLALVHVYRSIRLRDPRLPASALPTDWPGHEARQLFAQAYHQLSEAADGHIGRTLQGRDALLPTRPEPVEKRLISLQSGS